MGTRKAGTVGHINNSGFPQLNLSLTLNSSLSSRDCPIVDAKQERNRLLDNPQSSAGPYGAYQLDHDPSTQSNYRAFNVKSTSIKLAIDWNTQSLQGTVTFRLSVKEASTRRIVLDSSYLNINWVEIDRKRVTDFSVLPRNGVLGSAIEISYHGDFPSMSDLILTLAFSTTSKCTGLQWLTPEQTAGKKAPFMFSQCESIHARSIFPCFDTPSIKSPFEFAIQSQYPVVASGIRCHESEILLPHSDQKEYLFTQRIPIPSYLFSIASGDIQSAAIGPRSQVFSEPSSLKACQYEFAEDTENFIKAAENIVFEYEWQTYNVLVLPPSFPYGGMENPNMTFATPTLISGDRQNISVIAHELAHSWAGNLVTNVSWEHFWLNEGWTVYIERRILGQVYTEQHRHLSAIVGWNELQEDLAEMDDDKFKRYSPLIIDLSRAGNPDDSFSKVPYEKGFNLLFYLERILGGKPVFDPFIPFYFKEFRYRSLDSYQFKACLYHYFTALSPHLKAILDTVDWDSWFYTPGLPPQIPDFDTTLADQCYDLALRWAKVSKANFGNSQFDYRAQFYSKDIKNWTSIQIGVFLDAVVIEDMCPKAILAMDSIYGITSQHVQNAEIISRWYRVAIKGNLTREIQSLAKFLASTGRMKFVRPGYKLLRSVDPRLALATFWANEAFYHPICRGLLREDLGLS